jgi:hypothetical protein
MNEITIDGNGDPVPAKPVQKMHEWGPSRVGHGEAQCVHCLITNREAWVLGPYCAGASQTWITLEQVPRRLTVKGRAQMDPDCLVAYIEGSAEPLWIVDDGAKTDRCFVIGLGVRAFASLLDDA